MRVLRRVWSSILCTYTDLSAQCILGSTGSLWAGQPCGSSTHFPSPSCLSVDKTRIHWEKPACLKMPVSLAGSGAFMVNSVVTVMGGEERQWLSEAVCQCVNEPSQPVSWSCLHYGGFKKCFFTVQGLDVSQTKRRSAIPKEG